MSIISAPLGAFLLAILPMQGILGIDISTAVIAIGIIFFTHIPQPERGESASFTFWQDFVAGYRYIITWRGLVIILILAMVINFFFSATPLLITNHFKGDASNLACAVSVFCGHAHRRNYSRRVGRLQTQDHHRHDRLDRNGALTFAIGIIPSNLFFVGLIVNTALGLCIPIINGSIGATLQSSITPDMQGRVFASYQQSAAWPVSPLALIVAGPFADRFGISAVVFDRRACAVMGAAGFFFPDAGAP